MVASIGEQLRTTPSGVRKGTTGDIQEANGNKNALDAHAQVRLDHIDDRGMVAVGGGGRGGLELCLRGRGEAEESLGGLQHTHIRRTCNKSHCNTTVANALPLFRRVY